ncbi:Putative glutamate--cysteine ligase 2 [Kitasatospora sp. MMS16-BH015]|uniref:carboxylate-amine ligase n=1 Tax=Kitasatospora sp. MMS16-BH015 TaxID=2018025 RepID=UPI000CA24828|nr:YbdK family carboxylate-amine ligase [Kitasatospora sp. MMS16-BH015]AUG75376.1 Putative glutamate--cysteine ligase 2 [Kitasatospora sp. MMS16-BH015]
MTGRAGALRFGVEEEFLLVDKATRVTVPRAHLVVPQAALTLGPRAQHEFLASQVETCSRPVSTAAELRAELASARRAMAAAVESAGGLLVASGTAVLASRHPLPLTPSDRYRRVAAHVGPVADQTGGEISGCHVHLGDLTRADALAISAHLRPWLPVLQALCVNSPFCEGRDLGAASTRAGRYLAWPTCGPAPVLNPAEYERTVRRLIARRVILDRRMLYWYARPSEHLPTLEVRIADTNADLDVPVLLAVLLRALAHTFLAAHRAGTPPPRTPSTVVLREAHRQAALGGLAGVGTDPSTGRRLPMRRLVADLAELAAPALAGTGDLETALLLLHRRLTRGTGADRQRAVFARRHSLTDVVDDLARRTTASAALAAPVLSLSTSSPSDRLTSAAVSS